MIVRRRPPLAGSDAGVSPPGGGRPAGVGLKVPCGRCKTSCDIDGISRNACDAAFSEMPAAQAEAGHAAAGSGTARPGQRQTTICSSLSRQQLAICSPPNGKASVRTANGFGRGAIAPAAKRQSDRKYAIGQASGTRARSHPESVVTVPGDLPPGILFISERASI